MRSAASSELPASMIRGRVDAVGPRHEHLDRRITSPCRRRHRYQRRVDCRAAVRCPCGTRRRATRSPACAPECHPAQFRATARGFGGCGELRRVSCCDVSGRAQGDCAQPRPDDRGNGPRAWPDSSLHTSTTSSISRASSRSSRPEQARRGAGSADRTPFLSSRRCSFLAWCPRSFGYPDTPVPGFGVLREEVPCATLGSCR